MPVYSYSPNNASFDDEYNDVGLTRDDALYLWINNDHDTLKKDGIEVSAQKLTDNYENCLYSIFLKFHNDEIEDRVVHFYQSRGATTRFYTILGKNSNGLNLEEYNKFLYAAIGKCIATTCFEVAAVGFVLSGGFIQFVHQLNSDGPMQEVIATTGIISFLCSKAIELAAGSGPKGLNPKYHLDTFQLLAQVGDSEGNSKYTDEPIADIINNRLDDAYHGFLKQGGLNPELRSHSICVLKATKTGCESSKQLLVKSTKDDTNCWLNIAMLKGFYIKKNLTEVSMLILTRFLSMSKQTKTLKKKSQNGQIQKASKKN